MRHYRARVWCASLCVARTFRGEGVGDIIAPRRPRENWLRRDATWRDGYTGRTAAADWPMHPAPTGRDGILARDRAAGARTLALAGCTDGAQHACRAVARAVQRKAGCGWAALQGAQRGRHVGTSASPRRPLARKHSLLCTHTHTHTPPAQLMTWHVHSIADTLANQTTYLFHEKN